MNSFVVINNISTTPNGKINNKKYNKFCIYIIKNKNILLKEIYIGSTKNFSSRKSQHKKNTYNKRKKSYHRRLYRYIREHGGWDNFDMEILEYYPCDTIKEGQCIEFDYIDQMKPELNII